MAPGRRRAGGHGALQEHADLAHVDAASTFGAGLEIFAVRRALGTFDVVFCRNVLIYFDQATKVNVLERIYRQIMPDGFLLMGAAETLVGLTDIFVPLAEKRGLYVRAEPKRPKPKLTVAAR